MKKSFFFELGDSTKWGRGTKKKTFFIFFFKFWILSPVHEVGFQLFIECCITVAAAWLQIEGKGIAWPNTKKQTLRLSSHTQPPRHLVETYMSTHVPTQPQIFLDFAKHPFAPIHCTIVLHIIPNSLSAVRICPSTTAIHRIKAPATQTSHSTLSPDIINFSLSKKFFYFENSLRPFSTCLAELCALLHKTIPYNIFHHRR